MKRVIKKIAALDDALREVLDHQYPNGVRKEDLLSFPTPQGKRFYGIELRTEDTVFLIHIPNSLALQETGRTLQIDYSLKPGDLAAED